MRTVIDLIDALIQMGVILPVQRTELLARLRANGDDDFEGVATVDVDPLTRGLDKPSP